MREWRISAINWVSEVSVFKVKSPHLRGEICLDTKKRSSKNT